MWRYISQRESLRAEASVGEARFLKKVRVIRMVRTTNAKAAAIEKVA